MERPSLSPWSSSQLPKFLEQWAAFGSSLPWWMNASLAEPELPDLSHIITQYDLTKLSQCGGGTFGDVFVLQHSTLGRVALKRLRDFGGPANKASRDVSVLLGGNLQILLDLPAPFKRAKREAKLWMKLDHKNILPFLGIMESPQEFYFVSPYQSNGSLKAYLNKHPDCDRIHMVRYLPCNILEI